jgi:hypothetical protein
MKAKIFYLLILLVCISCADIDPKDQIQYIDGYWEIKQVEMPDGSMREFTINTSVDFIEVKGDSGVRKKLMPQYDGSFKEFPTVEKFTFIMRNDSLLMYYQTPFANWMETVIEATDSTLIVENKDRKAYVYKRFKKLELNPRLTN